MTLERTLLDAIRDRGRPFLFLSAAVALYLARIHQNDDVVLGVPVLNRADRAAKQVVGHFANTLPLRIRTAPEQTVDEFLAQLREATRTLLRHQKMPLGDLLRGASPLFDTTLSYMRGPPRLHRTPASRPWRRPTPMTRTRWPSGSPSSTGTATRRWISNTPAMCSTPTSPWTPRRHIEPSCAPWWRACERRLGELDPLSAAEREELIHTRNATDQAFPEQATLPTLFAEQVARTRNAPRCWKPTAARSAMPSWTPRSRP
ncbi:condensation domain-containing protein [Pseudomonas aeruginosa]|nr:condensation domain-containing protein [Pseudomonas aeruginosa]